MSQFIALKLSVAEDQHSAVKRSPLLAGAVQHDQSQLVSIYYDTRRMVLRREGIILRLRKNGPSWMQTVRRQLCAPDGLQRPPEWHEPYLNHFHFGSVDDGELRNWLSRDKLRDNLAAIFETNIRRNSWLVETGRARILVRLDRGWIASAGQREAVSELECQLQQGGVDDLFAFAETLGRTIALPPLLLTKGERGYRLFLGQAEQAVKAAPLALDPYDTPRSAFRQIALNCLFHLQHNHAGALRGDDPEYVHQMRVATRRLKAAMRLFRPVLPESLREELGPPLGQLMQTLGQTRDLDVLMSETVKPVAEALPEEPRLTDLTAVIIDRQYRTREKTRLTLQRPAYGQLLLLAGRLLNSAPLIDPPTDSTETENLLAFADRGLHKLLKRVQQLASAADVDYPPSLHELRIAIKRLRYGIEFFGPLLPDQVGARLVRRLATLQDELGQLNDLANAGILLNACAGTDANLREAVSLVAGWHGRRHAALLADIPSRVKLILGLKLPRLSRHKT